MIEFNFVRRISRHADGCSHKLSNLQPDAHYAACVGPIAGKFSCVHLTQLFHRIFCQSTSTCFVDRDPYTDNQRLDDLASAHNLYRTATSAVTRLLCTHL